MPAQLASWFMALEKVHCQSSTAIPPAFTEGKALEALRGPFLFYVASWVSASSSQVGLGSTSGQKKESGRLTELKMV